MRLRGWTERTRSRRDVRWLLTGRPGREGFLFHDGYHQPVHQAAPGLLGLIEGRHVIERWKPRIVEWLDEGGHFFNHMLLEFEDEPCFQPLRAEIEAMRRREHDPRAQNRLLFQYVTVLAGELERWATSPPRRTPFAALAPVSRFRGGDAPVDLSLNGTWSAYYRVGQGRYEEREMQLPVNWELVPGIDDYAGSMRFTRTFRVPASLQGQRTYLSFHGVDYFADVWINGHHLGGHEGCFAPFHFDVSPYLRYGGGNVVRLAVTSPNEPAGGGVDVTSGWGDSSPASAFPNRKTLVKGTLGHHDAKRGGAWSSMTSQDGNTGGVWNDVELRIRRPVHVAMAGLRVTTMGTQRPDAWGFSPTTVRIEVPIHNATTADVAVQARVVVEPVNFDGPSHQLGTGVKVAAGATEVAVVEEELPLRLWQPWDRGLPHLYSVAATLEGDGRAHDATAVETGFRTVSVTPLGESPGPNGSLVVNGEPVVVRGTNLLPTYWLSEYAEESIDRDFRMLREAGFNAVVVHTLVGPRRLYDGASRHGLLVLQIFPLQWSYEQSPELMAAATAQLLEMAALLYNHPAVVSYEVHNEPDMRTFEDLDNRLFDFELHAALRAADPHRWATTFSSGNHAYPGQFYPLRDDNSFQTLPARYEGDTAHGRRVARHRNLPTEFGIQAMPSPDLFADLLAEARVREVLHRLRSDPRWRSAGGEPWHRTEATLEEVKHVLGQGRWTASLEALDWSLLWEMGNLAARIAEAEGPPTRAEEDGERELASLKLASLLLEVLHYSAFKGENFWFGLWKPARTARAFVQSSQNRQYRLHKDAIETYLNAAVTGPITGYFSFMFRDADWQAPTWGVVDAGWAPKKAYRAYLESNQARRVTLPQALRNPVRLPGDPWVAGPRASENLSGQPWADAELIVANDTPEALSRARIELWVEDDHGARLELVDRAGHRCDRYRLTADVGAGGGFSYFDAYPERSASDPPWQWIVPETLPAGTYHLKAVLRASDGVNLSTNSYEIVVPDTRFSWLSGLAEGDVTRLLDGEPGLEGFHYWDGGRVVLRARPGVRGLLAGHRRAQHLGIDLYETTQGEHLFKHVTAELEVTDRAGLLRDVVWDIRSETMLPSVKTSTLLRYLQMFVPRAEEHLLGTAQPRAAARPPATASPHPAEAVPRPRRRREPTPVGSDRPEPARLFSPRALAPTLAPLRARLAARPGPPPNDEHA